MGSRLANLIHPEEGLHYNSIDQRPWYSIGASDSVRWVQELKKAIQDNRISLQDIEGEVNAGRVRPSLLYQLKNSEEHPLMNWDALIALDRDFVPPEFAVPASRIRKMAFQNIGLYAQWSIIQVRGWMKTKVSGKYLKKVTKFFGWIRKIWFKVNPFYQLFYVMSRLRSGWIDSKEKPGQKPYDITFVLEKKTTDRIKEAMCCEIAAERFKKYCVHYTGRMLLTLPDADVYYFADPMEYPRLLKAYPFLWKKRLWVLYTRQLKGSRRQQQEFYYALRFCEKVLCMNSDDMRVLREKNVDSSRILCAYSGVNPLKFLPHERETGAIGFCAGFRPRKRPQLIYEIVKNMPHDAFILLAPFISGSKAEKEGWSSYSEWNELRALPNLKIIEVPYGDFPQHLQQMDVFVSVSEYESGPMALLEAMMCNAVPVASRTGFATDLIEQGKNGCLFDVTANAEEIMDCIKRAQQIDADIRATVSKFTWSNFCDRLPTSQYAKVPV